MSQFSDLWRGFGGSAPNAVAGAHAPEYSPPPLRGGGRGVGRLSRKKTIFRQSVLEIFNLKVNILEIDFVADLVAALVKGLLHIERLLDINVVYLAVLVAHNAVPYALFEKLHRVVTHLGSHYSVADVR